MSNDLLVRSGWSVLKNQTSDIWFKSDVGVPLVLLLRLTKNLSIQEGELCCESYPSPLFLVSLSTISCLIKAKKQVNTYEYSNIHSTYAELIHKIGQSLKKHLVKTKRQQFIISIINRLKIVIVISLFCSFQKPFMKQLFVYVCNTF